MIDIDMARECTEPLSAPYNCLLFVSLLLFNLRLYQLL